MVSHEDIQRLYAAAGADDGLFSLAVLALIEKIMAVETGCSERLEFKELVRRYRAHADGHGYPNGRLYRLLDRILGDRSLSNFVRHEFSTVTREEAKGIAAHLREFCQIGGQYNPEVFQPIDNLLVDWDKHKPHLGSHEEFERQRKEIHRLREQNADLLSDVRASREAAALLKLQEAEVLQLRAKISVVESRVDHERQKNDETRKRLFELRQQLQDALRETDDLAAKNAEYRDTVRYVELMKRLTNFTRTRQEYETRIIRLTPEQQQVVDDIRLKKDFLAKGGAGTGKTLVLLSACEKAIRESSEELGMEDPGRKIIFLTYTRTLVQYEDYLATLLQIDPGMIRIRTVEEYLRSKIRSVFSGCTIEYPKSHPYIANYAPAFMEPAEFFLEVEGFLWANDYSYEEYIDQMIPRKGLKRPMSAPQRVEIWNAKTQLENRMMSDRQFTEAFSRVALSNALSSKSDIDSLADASFIFLDEAQDVNAVELGIFKKLASRNLIMAGDLDQCLYQAFSPYSRSGIDLRSATRILRSNFRNTIQIEQLSEAFRRGGGTGTFDEENQPKAFREGPDPELYQLSDGTELIAQLGSKVAFYLRELEYEPENICLLAADRSALSRISEVLGGLGIDSVNITKDKKKFSFAQTPGVRLSTFHSSKGLSFPAVLVYLPEVPAWMGKSRSSELQVKAQRNLIYVALTRAMENLSIFVKGPDGGLLSEIIEIINARGTDVIDQIPSQINQSGLPAINRWTRSLSDFGPLDDLD